MISLFDPAGNSRCALAENCRQFSPEGGVRGDNFAIFPVKFPCKLRRNRESTGGDEFAADCPHRHAPREICSEVQRLTALSGADETSDVFQQQASRHGLLEDCVETGAERVRPPPIVQMAADQEGRSAPSGAAHLLQKRDRVEIRQDEVRVTFSEPKPFCRIGALKRASAALNPETMAPARPLVGYRRRDSRDRPGPRHAMVAARTDSNSRKQGGSSR